MFEQASRLRLRFETSKGSLAVEDLWKLPLTSMNGQVSLDSIAISLNKQLTETGTSFVNKESNPNERLKLQFEIVKHMINVLLHEREQAGKAQVKAQKTQTLLEILERRENAEYEKMTPDEIRKLIAEVSAS